MEKEIRLFLKEHCIDSIEQANKKYFEWLDMQSLDFYLPKYNVAIECQGLQHFKPLRVFGGEEALKYRLNLDKTKSELCKEHGIRLLYYSNLGIEYPYEVFEDKDKLLEEITQLKTDN